MSFGSSFAPSFGPSFGSSFRDCGPPAFGSTTIIEEHHYHPIEASVAQPAFGQPVLEQPFGFPEALPPVMPPEPAIVRGQPVFDPTCETCAPNEDEFCDLSTGESAMIIGQDAWLRPFNLRFEIDYASDQDDVNRIGFGLVANVTGGLGVDTGVRLFRERDTDFRDHMWVGDFNVVYELFPTEFVRTRAGIGLNFLADHYGSDAGLNLTVGTDVFVGPVTFSGEMDLGTIGDSDLFHGRATAALRNGDHLEWFAGYDYLDIGGVEFSGFVAGMRFRY